MSRMIVSMRHKRVFRGDRLDRPCPTHYAPYMRAVEFVVELPGKPTLRVPADVASQLPRTGRARVLILTGDDREDVQWRRAAYAQFLRDDAAEDAVYDRY